MLYINGLRSLVIDGRSRKVTVGGFGADDARSFALAAVDTAGRLGPRTEPLAVVPNLVGLRLSEAVAALEVRGLVLGGKRTLSTGDGAALVVSQPPAAGVTLALALTPVFVVLSNPSGAAGAGLAESLLVIHVAGARNVSCAGSGRLRFQTQLSREATIVVRFLSGAGVPLDSTRFSRLSAGLHTINVRLPSGLSELRRYRMIVTASTAGQIVRAELGLTITRPGLRATAQSTACGA